MFGSSFYSSGLTGNGTANQVARFTISSQIGNSLITDNGVSVTIPVAAASAAAGATPAGTAGTITETGGAGGAASTTSGGTSSAGGVITYTSGNGGAGAATTNGASNAGLATFQGGTGGASAGTGAGGIGGGASVLGGTGGAGSGSTNPGAGGVITVTGGNAGTGGTGNANGGNVNIDGGTKSGTGTPGTVNIATTNATAINIGNSGSTTTVAGIVSFSSSTILVSSVNLSGLTTSGLSTGQFGYISSNNTLSATDNLTLTKCYVIGCYQGTSGTMLTYGIVPNAQFTTAGGSPVAGAPVYLAASTDDSGMGVGKLTATVPGTGTVAAQVGLCVDNTNYVSAKTCKVLIQILTPIQL